jgi:diaminopimelate decarboxylase
MNFASHYAVKANANQGVLNLVKKSGFGVDVVSKGEAQWALENGFQPSDIIFSGVAKSKDELTFAIQQQIKQINVESLPELERIGGLCRALQKTARVGLRLNPDIKVDTHPYITTGFRENKFGIPEEQISQAVTILKKYHPWIELKGLSSHLGSQIRDLSPLADSLGALISTSSILKAQGFQLATMDIGGGVGIDYHSADETNEFNMIRELGEVIRNRKSELPPQLLLEPGRWIVARSGVLCAQVEYIKNNGFKNFAILNTGMNHLMRPALYKAFHRIAPVVDSKKDIQLYDVVGPICESSDVLGNDRQLPKMREGDWLAIMDAGAYGFSMANFYNRHEFPSEILI